MVGGITILCLGGLFKAYSNSKIKTEEKEEDKLRVVDGDVLNYSLPHVKPSCDAVYFSGLPNGFNFHSLKAIYDLFARLVFRLERKKVNFLNARTRKHLDIKKCGFKITSYKEDFDPKEWQVKENQQKFEKDMEALILKEFPGAKIGQWFGCLFRGDEGQNPAAIDGPHLDNFPDENKASEWRGDFENKYTKQFNDNESFQRKMKSAKKYKYIGLWKPVNMKNPVYDNPLALMDMSTFRPWEDAVEFRQEMSHIDQGERVWFKNLGGHIRYNEDQKWYYYPNMTTDEILIFTHFTSTNGEANPHTSFKHPGAPKDVDSDSRKSVEARCMIYWPGDE